MTTILPLSRPPNTSLYSCSCSRASLSQRLLLNHKQRLSSGPSEPPGVLLEVGRFFGTTHLWPSTRLSRFGHAPTHARLLGINYPETVRTVWTTSSGGLAQRVPWSLFLGARRFFGVARVSSNILGSFSCSVGSALEVFDGSENSRMLVFFAMFVWVTCQERESRWNGIKDDE